jgi:hypothetical protein
MSRKALVPIQLPADPVNALEAATKQYVDAHDMPVGGTVNQVLAKTSATNYATAWVDSGGGGGATGTAWEPVVAMGGF